MQARTIFFFLFLCLFATAQAQNGTIKGQVTDAKSGFGLPGVNVLIKGTTIGASTDLDGNYTISNLAPGYYTIYASYISYKPFQQDFKLEPGKTISFNIKLEEDVAELAGIEVVAERVRNTETAALMEVKKSELVINAISAQQISKSQDRDAGQVIRRIPGITIQDDRFVIVRGLAERYNTVMLNDVIAPSTEADKRSFSFDLVPSNMIERMLVFKSGSAEIPGEFGGAVIKIYTKNQVEQNFNSISIGTGVRLGSTFTNGLRSNTSSTDFLGFDDGGRDLPADFPRRLGDLGFQYDKVAEATKTLENDWALNDRMALPDLRLRYDMGRKFKIKGKQVSTLNSVSYSQTSQVLEIDRFRYINYEADFSSIDAFNYNDQSFANNVRTGLISNWAIKLNSANTIEFKNLLSQNGNQETVRRQGKDFFQGFDVDNYSLYYQQRMVFNTQLSGTHQFNAERSEIHWALSYSRTNRSEPDWRRARTQRNIDTNEPFRVVIPPSANTFDAARFFSRLFENIYTSTFDYKHVFGGDVQKPKFTLRAGYYAEYKAREFAARWMAYRQSSANGFDQNLLQLSLDQIFDNANIGFPTGFILNEGTNFTDSYDASNLLLAGYGGGAWNISEKVNVNFGLRTEFNRQQLNTRISQAIPVNVDNPILSLLPFLNATYKRNDFSQFRLAYSRTINRPEFRELAPFSFYDFNFAIDVVGNERLEIATINNVDLKYEFFPSPSEQIAVGVFYKQFTNPIETYIVTGTSNPIFLFRNAASAVSYGAEVEVRKNLGLGAPGSFINRFNVILNAALIRSEIDLGEDSTLTQDRRRPLQGQSPYVVNTGLYYNDQDRGLQVSLLYNIYGRRIFTVGDREIPTIYEMPRNLVDLSISKKLTDKIDAKLGVSDLLNAELIFREDGNYDSRLDNELTDKPVLRQRFGPYITFDLNFKL